MGSVDTKTMLQFTMVYSKWLNRARFRHVSFYVERSCKICFLLICCRAQFLEICHKYEEEVAVKNGFSATLRNMQKRICCQIVYFWLPVVTSWLSE